MKKGNFKNTNNNTNGTKVVYETYSHLSGKQTNK